MNGKNIEITKAEIDFIKGLEPFDLTMLLSEINDHGWPMARKLIVVMADVLKRNAVGQA